MYFSHADSFVLRIQSAPFERKSIRIGLLKTCCVKAAVINVHVDLIGMHYPLDATMVPADFYERRPIVDVMNPKWLSSISWVGFVWLSHGPKIQQLFTSQLPERSKTQQEQQVCCCQLRKTTLSGQFEGCVFSPLCSQLVNISSEIKWLHRLQHVFGSSCWWEEWQSIHLHILCHLSLSEWPSFAKMVLVGQRWCFSIVKPLCFIKM